MVRIDMVPIRCPMELVKDREAPLDDLEISMSFSQTLKGKKQVVQGQKAEKDDGLCKTEEVDSVKRKPASISLQTNEIVQSPAETMVQPQVALNQMLETAVNHTPDSELTSQEQLELLLEPDSTSTVAAATDVRLERVTAAKAGDRWMPDYTELKTESSLHIMKPRAFSPDREAEASKHGSELGQASFVRMGKEAQPVIPREEHSRYQEAVD